MGQSSSYYLESLITREQAEQFLHKKRIDKKVELTYFPYRVYLFEVEIQRLFFKAKLIKLALLLNGMSGQFNPIQFNLNECKVGSHSISKVDFRLDIEEYDQKSKKEVVFYLIKRYYLVREPTITCTDVFNLYYPFWQFSENEGINGRDFVIEKIS